MKINLKYYTARKSLFKMSELLWSLAYKCEKHSFTLGYKVFFYLWKKTLDTRDKLR